MRALCPAQQLVVNNPLYRPKAFARAHVSMIVGPAPQYRVELAYQRPCRLPQRAFDAISEFLHQRLHAVLGRFDDQLVPVFAHVLAQEVKARLDVGDHGLLLRELQSAFGQEGHHGGFDNLFQGFRFRAVTTKSSA